MADEQGQDGAGEQDAPAGEQVADQAEGASGEAQPEGDKKDGE